MKVTIITFCLIGAVFANPILHNVSMVSSQLDSNSTESLSVSQSSENDTSELQSSEENASNQSSESESLESTSEDKTSEESDSQSDEDSANDSMPETKDDSMGSEENVRKSWVRVFANVVKVLSAEYNSSTEVKGQMDSLSNELMEKQSKGSTNLQLQENPTDSSDTTSNSADTSDGTDTTAAISDSSESTSSESNESNDTSENSDSSDASKSTEDSNASNSSEMAQLKDCVNGTQSCESEEYFFQNIGDDAHFSVDNLMVPDEDERQLNLRRR